MIASTTVTEDESNAFKAESAKSVPAVTLIWNTSCDSPSSYLRIFPVAPVTAPVTSVPLAKVLVLSSDTDVILTISLVCGQPINSVVPSALMSTAFPKRSSAALFAKSGVSC